MNAKSLKDFLAAASACAPSASFAGPRKLAADVAKAAPSGDWEIGVCGSDETLLRLAFHTSGGRDDALAAAASRVFGLRAAALAGASSDPRPPLEAIWNSRTSRWQRVGAAPGKPRAPKKFSAEDFEEPVASTLATFDALAPIRTVLFARDRPGWTLILAAPQAWHLFLRCDVAASFAPRADRLSLLLRGARVFALDFDGDALWANLAG